MIGLVAFDLDGTVLTAKNEASETSLDAIRALIARGIVVASISGRNVGNSQRPFAADPELARIFYFGCYNGSVVLSSETNGQRELLHEERLPGEIFWEAIDYIDRRQLSFIYCGCEIGSENIQETYIADRNSESVEALVELVGLDMACDERLISRIRKKELRPPPKLIVLPGTENRDQILGEMKEVFADRAYLSATGEDRLELMHRDVNKGFALQAVAEVCGVSIDETLAVGDGDNDLPMLQKAGVGVLLESADEATLRAARDSGIHLGESFEAEGFAKAVLHYALSEKTD